MWVALGALRGRCSVSFNQDVQHEKEEVVREIVREIDGSFQAVRPDGIRQAVFHFCALLVNTQDGI